jgi:hypothetical protein
MIIVAKGALVDYTPLRRHLDECGLESVPMSDNLYRIIVRLEEVATAGAQAAVQAEMQRLQAAGRDELVAFGLKPKADEVKL